MAQCIRPIILKDKIVPCGKCGNCIENKSNEWFVRLKTENLNSILNGLTTKFVTLTYEDDSLVIKQCYYRFKEGRKLKIGKGVERPILWKPDLKKFIRDLREIYKDLKIFAIGEYGPENLRPHYHIIIFNLPIGIEPYKNIQKIWNKGLITISEVTDGRIKYCCRYQFGTMRLPNDLYYSYPPSKCKYISNGLGKCFLTDSIIKYYVDTLQTFVQFGSKKYRLPKYYRDKLFTDHEKEIIRKRNENYINCKARSLLDHFTEYNHNIDIQQSLYYEEQKRISDNKIKQFDKSRKL